MRNWTAMALAILASAFVLSTEAAAHDWRRDGWRDDGHWRHHHRHHYVDRGCGGYYNPCYVAPPPRVVYAPPQYYTAPPVYYAPQPVFSITIR